jgi:putative salt-induced outer membrane protein
VREGTFDFSFVATTGNSSTQSIGLSGDVIFRPTNWEIRNKAAFVKSSTDDELRAQSVIYFFRASRTLTSRMSAYGQYDFQRDRFAGIEQRHTVSGGVSYLLVDRERHAFSVDGGLGYANEQRAAGDDLSTAVADLGWAYKFKLSDTAEVTDDFRFNASLSDGDDWRIGHIIAVTAKMTGLLSLKLSNAVRFRNAPPETFKQTDTITSMALVAKF